MPGVADNIIEGLTTFCVETQNTALAPAGAGVLKQVLDAYEGQVGANEECVLAGLDPNLTRLVVGSGRICPMCRVLRPVRDRVAAQHSCQGGDRWSVRGLIELYGLESCCPGTHSLSGVVGKESDGAGREGLDRRRPVD